MNKQFYQSKRFWTGVIGLLTGISLILTGENTFQAVLPELILTTISLIQTIIGIKSSDDIYVGSKKI